jgi:tetratricopeptide (TPR) repeat protein
MVDIASTHLAIGRANLMQAQQEGINLNESEKHLQHAMDGFRKSGVQNYLCLGLLARAELHRAMGASKLAQKDLDEALTIATRGGLRLREADCYIEYTRLNLALDRKDKARENLVKAEKMITEICYYRRIEEEKDLEAQL